ncbi:MAG: thioredoxin domain-containing protein [Sphingobium sp.]|nr:thioredoxin domain-containing protein [Sphingobium sp.]
MIRMRFVPLLLATMALAGCSKSDDTSPGASTEAVKPVAPPAGTSWTDKVVATPEGGVRMGNPDAPIKMIEYGSLSCPHCAKLAQDGFEKLMKDYVGSGRVSLEFRSFIIHPQDTPLTLLVKCGPTESFFPLVEQIYANFDAMQEPLNDPAVAQRANAALQGPGEQRMIGLADALKYTEFFSARGLTVDKAHACLADAGKVKELADLTQKYSNDGINQTPTVLVNGNQLEKADWADIEIALKQAGAR